MVNPRDIAGGCRRRRNSQKRYTAIWDQYKMKALFVVGVSTNWANDRKWQTKLLETWNKIQLSLLQQESDKGLRSTLWGWEWCTFNQVSIHIICTANWSWHPHQPAPVVKKNKPQSTFYTDAPFTKLQEKMCGLSALPWRPNSTAANRSWRRQIA